jgi:hypothetical protein
VTWTFGDGPGTGTPIDHAWGAVGTYQVSARATMADGRVAVAGITMQVSAVPIRTFRLTIETPQRGTVSGPGFVCPPTCTRTLNEGTSVTLTPKPTVTANVFEGWGGACAGQGATCTLTMNGNKFLFAAFSFEPFSLPAPVLISPANGAVLTNHTVTFRWNKVAGAVQYNIVIDCAGCGGGNQIDDTTSATSYTATLPPLIGLEVLWKVSARPPNDTFGEESEQWGFTAD